MAHATIALYILVELAGISLALLALLYYRRVAERGYLYFGAYLAGAMVSTLCETLFAYCHANGLVLVPWIYWLTRALYGAAHVVQFLAFLRLGFEIARIRVPRWVVAVQLVTVVAYAVESVSYTHLRAHET